MSQTSQIENHLTNWAEYDKQDTKTAPKKVSEQDMGFVPVKSSPAPVPSKTLQKTQIKTRAKQLQKPSGNSLLTNFFKKKWVESYV